MNRMIEFSKENRTTSFFRDYEIAQIKIAYRVMEYLQPDDNFPPKDLDKTTMILILNKQYGEASRRIEDEVFVDIDSSHWSHELRKNTVELMEHLMPLYLKDKENNKNFKKQQLLRQLAELEEEEC